MKINPKLGKNPADLSSMKFATMKKLLKQDLKRLEKTSIDSPTMFMLTGAYDYPDKKGVALPIIGRQTIDWKLHAKNEVIKRDTGCIGRVYFNNINADGQKVIVFDVARGKGKAKIGKLEKGLKKIVSQSTHQLIFNSVDEAVLDQLEAVMDAAGDTLDEDIDDLADTENESDLLDEGDVNIDTKTQSYDMLLSTNLTKLSAQFVPVRDTALKGETNDAEDVELLLDYATEWLELYGEADTNAKTKFAPRLPQVETIKAFATKLMGAPTKQTKTAAASSNISSTVQKGSKGADVVTVQKLLLKNGADLGKWGADGDAGSATDAAIRAFQTKNGLPVTGTVEPNSPSWLALNGQTPAPALAPENVQLQMGAGVSGIPAAQMRVLQEILAKAGEPTARITSYRRSPEQQAQVMFNNIIRDGAARNQTAYKNPAAAAQVVKAFNDAMNAGKDGAAILAAVTAAVNAVGAANLSDHCAANPAIDIDPKSLKNTGNFNAALQADSRVKAIMPPADSTYHLLINA